MQCPECQKEWVPGKTKPGSDGILRCRRCSHNRRHALYKKTEKGKAAEKRNRLKRYYGLTEDEFNQMIVQQLNRCRICCDTFSTTPHVDHNHTTGKVRGLLCASCNKGIGLLQDDPQLLREAAHYIEKDGM